MTRQKDLGPGETKASDKIQAEWLQFPTNGLCAQMQPSVNMRLNTYDPFKTMESVLSTLTPFFFAIDFS